MKFSDTIAEALYCDMPDGQTGTVDGFGRWVGLYRVSEPWKASPGVTVPTGFYLVTEDSDGSVTCETFATEEAVQEAFDRWEADYGRYLDAQDTYEAQITSSTGRTGR